MGCGASKSSDPSAVVPQGKAPQAPSASQAAASLKSADQGAHPDTTEKSADDAVLVKQLSAKTGYAAKLPAGDGSSERPTSGKQASERSSKDAVAVAVVTPTKQSVPDAATSERPGSGGEADNPARAAFRSQFAGLQPTDGSPAPQPSITFKSSRSLNRSIGVRRRTSDSGGQGGGEQQDGQGGGRSTSADGAGSKRGDQSEDEGVMQSPDSVLEKFEKMKGVNPLLRKATAGAMCQPSQRTLKSQKRLAVGFALADPGEAGAKAEEAAAGGGGVEATVRTKGDGEEEAKRPGSADSGQRGQGAAATVRSDGGG